MNVKEAGDLTVEEYRQHEDRSKIILCFRDLRNHKLKNHSCRSGIGKGIYSFQSL